MNHNNAKDSLSTDSTSNESSPCKDQHKLYLDYDGKVIRTIPEKHKTELCKNFSERGHCRYGDKCRFAHGYQELKSVRNSNDHYRQRKCKGFWENNHCKYGRRCQFSHHQGLDWVDKLVLVVGECYANPKIGGSSKLLAMLQKN